MTVATVIVERVHAEIGAALPAPVAVALGAAEPEVVDSAADLEVVPAPQGHGVRELRADPVVLARIVETDPPEAG